MDLVKKEKAEKEKEKENMIIYNYQLSNNKYDIVVLENNIDRLSLKKLLQTQYLTVEFCNKYLLHPDLYGMSNEDSYITVEDILLYQPHLREKYNKDLKKV
jgi:hypothetical protein